VKVTANKITQKRVRELFDYGPFTGKLIWKVSLSNRALIGSSAGGKSLSKGYSRVMIDKKSFAIHRLVWIYHNGEIPDGLDIDHKDLDRGNSRIENLRIATRSQNNVNVRTRNMLGLKGVKKNGGGFQARITIKGKRVNLGTYETAEKAHQVYLEKSFQVNGEFTRAA